MRTFDAIVIGLGGMGAAAAYQLAQRGLGTLGLEQFAIGHDRGSSHGQSRIIRRAYFEHPDYVPLLHASYQLWGALEQELNTTFIHRTGLLLVGGAVGEVIAGVRRSAREHYIGVDELSLGELAARFPGFKLDGEQVALFEPDAGYLPVEAAVAGLIELARRAGAELVENEVVRGWEFVGRGVQVNTNRGAYQAGRLVIASGAWSAALLREVGAALTPIRKMQLWFRCSDSRYAPENGAPAFCFDEADGFFYGFPQVSPGEIKVAEHSGHEPVADASLLDRTLHPRDVERVARFVRRRLPGVTPEVTRHSACMYTMTPDKNFVVDRFDGPAPVAYAAGFSGHGFKFAPLIGSVLADLVTKGSTDEPIGFLSARRLADGKAAGAPA